MGGCFDPRGGLWFEVPGSGGVCVVAGLFVFRNGSVVSASRLRGRPTEASLCLCASVSLWFVFRWIEQPQVLVVGIAGLTTEAQRHGGFESPRLRVCGLTVYFNFQWDRACLHRWPGQARP